MKYLINRRVNIFEDEDGYTYKVVDYLLFELWDDDYDPYYQPEGEVKGMLFQFTIKEDDNSIFEDNEKELEFLDPYDDEFYELNELESIFTNDVSEFGDKLSTIIDVQKVKETISKYENDKVVKEELWDEDNNPTEKRDEVVKQYEIKDDNPSSMDSGLIGTKLFKRDITGLMSYFEERPNMERLFNELTHFTREGYTVEEYLDNTNIMDDEEVKTIIGLSFVDISGFLEDMLKIEENIELRKDYESCLTISKILLKKEI